MSESPAKLDSLRDGSVLLFSKERYITDPTSHNLVMVLMCLKDSWVHLPQGNEGAQASLVVGPSGGRYFPIFSQPAQAEEQPVALREAPYVQCVRWAHECDCIEGLVLDPFTKPMVLPFPFADAAANIDTRNAPYRE
ncbi:MAG: SseB family protein [Clostridia bacterium]|nr:SseB family protein [Clostridia bacterium]